MCVAIGALVVVLLSEHGRRARHEHLAIPAMFAAARAVPVVLAACLLFLVGGLAEIVVSTLTPWQLHENGLSSGEIGFAFAACAAAFVLVSSVVARLASRLVTVHAATIAIVLLAASLIPLVLITSTTAVVAGIIVGLCLATAGWLSVLPRERGGS